MFVLLQFQNEYLELQVDVIFNDCVINFVIEGVDLLLRLGDVFEGFFVVCLFGIVCRVLFVFLVLLVKMGYFDMLDVLIDYLFVVVFGVFVSNCI